MKNGLYTHYAQLESQKREIEREQQDVRAAILE